MEQTALKHELLILFLLFSLVFLLSIWCIEEAESDDWQENEENAESQLVHFVIINSSVDAPLFHVPVSSIHHIGFHFQAARRCWRFNCGTQLFDYQPLILMKTLN